MTAANYLLRAAGSSAEKLYVDDVFSTWLYTGNGSTQTINNGIDLAGKGGMVWIKGRTSVVSHAISATTLAREKNLVTNTTNAAAGNSGAGDDITAFNGDGFSLGINAWGNRNSTGVGYVSWTFRNADKFYNHAVVTKTAGSNATVSFANLSTLGMVRVKRTDSTGSWYIWHRSLSAGQLLIGETTAAAATLGHVTVSGTTVTLVNGVIADGAYLVEAFAHDTSADGIIQCGSYTGTGSPVDVNLGWEPQFLLIKIANVGGINWFISDSMRGFGVSTQTVLYPNLNNAESAPFAAGEVPTATGFRANTSASTTYIYLAIRRPNKPPTTGTQVFMPRNHTGTGGTTTVTTGFVVDLAISEAKNSGGSSGTGAAWVDRLRGIAQNNTSPFSRYLISSSTNAEASYSANQGPINSDNTTIGYLSDGSFLQWNGSGVGYGQWFFRRAPGVHEQICYNGSGSNKTEAHNLAKAPELWMAKRRDSSGSWTIGSSLLNANEKIVMPSPNGRVTDATAWNSTYPTATALSLGTLADVNASGGTYVAYLWASTAGISKVFTYTGNGTSQTINCGFTTGARFVMIIRVTASTAQDIYVWDSARGITSGNDPRLSLNTTAAEVTTLDTIDPASNGFVVNTDASNTNVNGAVYIGLAYA